MSIEKLTLFVTSLAIGFVGFSHSELSLPSLPEPIQNTNHKTFDFKIDSTGHNWIKISWSPMYAFGVRHYKIHRGDTLISTVDAINTTFTDLHLKGTKSYLYRIESIGHKGEVLSVNNLTATTKINHPPKFHHKEVRIKIGNRAMGSQVYQLDATDPNDDPLYFSIQNGDSNLFLVNETTGRVIIKKDLLPNKEFKFSATTSDGYRKAKINLVFET